MCAMYQYTLYIYSTTTLLTTAHLPFLGPSAAVPRVYQQALTLVYLFQIYAVRFKHHCIDKHYPFNGKAAQLRLSI